MEQTKESLLTELANNLLSNKITENDLSNVLKSIAPLGPRWLLYNIKQIIDQDIGIDIATIISDYTSTLKIYNLSSFESYSIPYKYNYYPKQLTISFWCKPQCLNQDQTIVSTEPTESADSKSKFGYGFQFTKENKFVFNVMSGDGYKHKACSISSKTNINRKTINRWMHCCGVYNSLNGESRLYINGELQGVQFVNDEKNKLYEYALEFTSKCDLQIGALPSKAQRFYGLLYDVQIYDKLLTDNDDLNSIMYGSLNDENLILNSTDLISWNGEKYAPLADNENALEPIDDFYKDENAEFVSTPNRYEYRHWFNVKENWVKFNVSARNDAHIALGSDCRHNGNHYEIVLGGWGNTQSVIRTRNQGHHHYTHPEILKWQNGNKYISVWISWDPDKNGDLQIGRGSCIGKNVFMRMKMVNQITIKYLSVSNGWGSTGEWQIFNVTKYNGK